MLTAFALEDLLFDDGVRIYPDKSALIYLFLVSGPLTKHYNIVVLVNRHL